MQPQLCVTYSASSILNFQQCTSGNANQQFRSSAGFIKIAGNDTLCLGAFGYKGPKFGALLGVDSCKSTGKDSIRIRSVAFPPKPRVQGTAVDTLKMGGQCIDGTNAGGLTVAQCSSNNAYQLWYSSFGQIRNVGNGLCWNAPSANSGDLSTKGIVNLAPCAADRSQLWIFEESRVIYSGQNHNCIRRVNGILWLGTNRCNANDALAIHENRVVSNLFLSAPSIQNCVSPVSRMDFRDLSPTKQKQFLTGLQILKTTPSDLVYGNRYNDFVQVHAIGAEWYHNTPSFLPWHRVFLRLFEQELQQVLNDPTFGLPYWAWGADSATWYLPETGILTATNFGTTGLFTQNHCLPSNSAFANWTTTYNTCITRYFSTATLTTDSSDQDALFSETIMLTALQINPETAQPYASYTEFNDFINLPHGIFHMQVAGSLQSSGGGGGGGVVEYGTLSNLHSSPDDPVFWLHHGNLDRYFKYFQKINPELMSNRGYERGGGAVQEIPPGSGVYDAIKVDDPLVGLTGWAVKHGLEMDSGIMCYDEVVYSESIEVIQFVFDGLGKRGNFLGKRGTTKKLKVPEKVKTGFKKINNAIKPALSMQTVYKFKNKKRNRRAKKVAKLTLAMSKRMMMDFDKMRKKEEKVHSFIKGFRARVEKQLGTLFNTTLAMASNEMHMFAVGHAIQEYIP
ncbi:hypothetical protein BDR26DRAFT_929729 [Obelidium mucronatum]|nr:hypothetical protein BDR26DRAFT_929729 [Obelidium mucronatum]